MSEPQKKFYLTTPIYYVNARPHIGHAYTTIAADVIARRHRLLGDDTFLLTGTDEHGQKIERSAAAAGIPPQQFADQVSASFKALWDRMGITYNDYIRTTDPRHKRGVQKLWKTLADRGAIYLSSYTGQYSIGEEMFVEGPPGTIGPDGKPTETVTEENYFFKLSDYQLRIIDLIESNELLIQPEVRRNEVLSFLRGNVTAAQTGTQSTGAPSMAQSHRDMGGNRTESKDQAFLRRRQPLPPRSPKRPLHLPQQLQMGNPRTRRRKTRSLRLARRPRQLHDRHRLRQRRSRRPSHLRKILARRPPPRRQRDHPLPLRLLARLPHGRQPAAPQSHHRPRLATLRRLEDVKIPRQHSPHRNHPRRLRHPLPAQAQLYRTKAEQDLFASDVLRYFLLREIPFGQDGSFSFDALVQRYNSDLANGYGNLVSRTLSMIHKYFDGIVPPVHDGGFSRYGNSNDPIRWTLGTSWNEATESTWRELPTLEQMFATLLIENKFSLSLELIQEAISIVDGHISVATPWKFIPANTSDKAHWLQSCLYTAAESIRIITALLYPILPYATAKVWTQLGLGDIELAAKNGELKNLQWGGLKPGTKLGPLSPIFPRAPKELIQLMTDMENPRHPSKLTGETTATAKADPHRHPTDHPQPRPAPPPSPSPTPPPR